MERLLLKVREAAPLVAMGQTKFYALVRSGEIPSIRVGRSRLISADALREWVRRQQSEGEIEHE